MGGWKKESGGRGKSGESKSEKKIGGWGRVDAAGGDLCQQQAEGDLTKKKSN